MPFTPNEAPAAERLARVFQFARPQLGHDAAQHADTLRMLHMAIRDQSSRTGAQALLRALGEAVSAYARARRDQDGAPPERVLAELKALRRLYGARPEEQSLFALDRAPLADLVVHWFVASYFEDHPG